MNRGIAAKYVNQIVYVISTILSNCHDKMYVFGIFIPSIEFYAFIIDLIKYNIYAILICFIKHIVWYNIL